MCYTAAMTEADVIAHWRKGARDALEAAHLLHNGGKYALALFDMHLAVEKALKTVYMEQCRKEAPMTHDLLQIANQLDRHWTNEEKTLFADLTTYAVAARYDDPVWAEREATEQNSSAWLTRVTAFLSVLLP